MMLGYICTLETQRQTYVIDMVADISKLHTDCHAQSLATNSPAPGPRPLTCGVSSECLGTRSYETTSRDQRGKIEMFFSSTGACTAAKFPIANHRSSIVAQLYFASVIQ